MSNNLAPLILFSEISTIDQLIRAQISKILPDNMAISHLSVLDLIMNYDNNDIKYIILNNNLTI